MSNEISRVYQFLAERPDWKTEMDTNNDGTILKSEFRDFLTAEFDWASLEGWNGETSKQTDLINEFWKNIDTTQTGNITGTNFKNKNALDSKEIANMNTKIEMYEILNDYTSTLSVPSVVSDGSRWKQSVSQSLANLTETFIKNGGTKDELLAYLESMSPSIQNKTTADCVADEYLNSELKDFMKEYNYSYLEDTTLQGIINNYIKNIPEGSTAEDIKSTVELIVDAYLATAGLKEDNAFDLGAYGYTVNDATALNDLQKTYLTKTLQTAFENVQNEANYEANKELYDNAVNEYINNILSNAKFNDFESIKSYTYEMFTNSEQYKETQDIITVKDLLKGDDLYNRVASDVNQSLADLIKNDGRYLEVMDDIEAEMITKVKSGDFSVNGDLDTNAALDWIIEQVKDRIEEFYKNGLSDLGVNELNDLYEQMSLSADNELDDDKSLSEHRNAAIKYCDALVAKSSKLKELVENIFATNYKTEINNMYPNEIKAKMQELQEQALTIGDPKDLVLSESSWGLKNSDKDLTASRTSAINSIREGVQKMLDSATSIVEKAKAKVRTIVLLKNIFGTDDYVNAINNMDSESLISAMNKAKSAFNIQWEPTKSNDSQNVGIISLQQGETQTFNISPSFTDKNGNSVVVTSDRITYKSSNPNLATVDENGVVTVNGNNMGTYTVTISVYVDGQIIGEPKTIQINVQPTTEKVIGDVKDWGGLKTEHIETWSVNKNKQIIETSFSDLYNQDATIRLHVKMDKNAADWSNQKEVVQERITQVGDLVVAALATSGLDKAKLQTAAATVINRYMTQGIAATENDKGTSSTDLTNNAHNYMTENRELTRDQIVQCKDTDGKDSVVFMIHFKDFVDSVLEEYWKLV